MIKPRRCNAVTFCRKKLLETAVFRRVEQCDIYWKYTRWRPRLVALLPAVSHFSLARCPRACLLTLLRVLLLTSAYTRPCLPPLGTRSGSPPCLDARFPTKSLWNGMIFSFPYGAYRRSIKRVMRLRSSIPEPKRSVFHLTNVSEYEATCLLLKKKSSADV
jgi:hypothetical protein